MANDTHRVFPSALVGAQHNVECEKDTARDMPEFAFDIKNPDNKLIALDVITSELRNVWDDDRTPDMSDDDIRASVAAEAEEIYQAWILL